MTSAQAGAAARKYFDPKDATLVIVGDAQLFWDAVKDERAGMERINIDELELGKAGLK